MPAHYPGTCVSSTCGRATGSAYSFLVQTSLPRGSRDFGRGRREEQDEKGREWPGKEPLVMIRPLTLTPRPDGRGLVASARWSPLIHACRAEPSSPDHLFLPYPAAICQQRSPYDLTLLGVGLRGTESPR